MFPLNVMLILHSVREDTGKIQVDLVVENYF